jgi:hypothetical protein
MMVALLLLLVPLVLVLVPPRGCRLARKVGVLQP